MGKVLSISNHKGGVGKTTSTIMWSRLNKLGKSPAYRFGSTSQS
jgi:cellulose biosynthesis protein BcsQ